MELLDFQKERLELIKFLLPNFGENFILKGGTALILYHGLERFSEDIDLDSRNMEMDIKKFLVNPGFNRWKINIKKNTNTVFRAMIDYGAENLKGDYPLKIEVSSRNMDFLANDMLPYRKIGNVNVYEIETLADMKLAAFLDRTTARDVYDLGFLISKHPDVFSNEDYMHIRQKIDIVGLEDLSYLLKIEMDEHRLADIDTDIYVLQIYENVQNNIFKSKHAKVKETPVLKEFKESKINKNDFEHNKEKKLNNDIEL